MAPSGDTSTTSPVARPHTTNDPFGVHSTAPIPGADGAAPASAAASVSPTASLAVRRRPPADHFRRYPSCAAVRKTSASCGLAVTEERLAAAASASLLLEAGRAGAGPSTRTEESPESSET